MSVNPPIVEVYYDELTYEMLKEEMYSEQIQVNTNRPQSALQRLTTDVFGLAALYAITFLACDILRTLKDGEWTSIVWMVIGPWKALTGAPLISRLLNNLGYAGHSKDVVKCRSEYEDAVLECQKQNVFRPLELQNCCDAAMSTQQSCIADTEEYQECVYKTTDALGYIEKYAPGVTIHGTQSLSPEEHCMDDMQSTYGIINA